LAAVESTSKGRASELQGGRLRNRSDKDGTWSQGGDISEDCNALTKTPSDRRSFVNGTQIISEILTQID